ncbi:response regulator [Ferrovibrio xuzhouensis]|uniref:Response regulator n=1 Tax=Ferrovibrio xuzhouensis TaxID=1576914 RepID=A0ABV7VIS9_9PROT
MTKLMIVEDNPENLDMLSRRLLKRGFAICSAVTGEEALEAAPREKPDLILMDIGLGAGLDGLETTRRLKAMPVTAQTPVIALTAHALAADRELSLAAGCADYDTKPVDLPRLLAKIEAQLGSATTGHPA